MNKSSKASAASTAAPKLAPAKILAPKPVKQLEPPAEPKSLDKIRDDRPERPIKARPRRMPTPFSSPKPKRPR